MKLIPITNILYAAPTLYTLPTMPTVPTLSLACWILLGFAGVLYRYNYLGSAFLVLLLTGWLAYWCTQRYTTGIAPYIPLMSGGSAISLILTLLVGIPMVLLVAATAMLTTIIIIQGRNHLVLEDFFWHGLTLVSWIGGTILVAYGPFIIGVLLYRLISSPD